MYRDVQIVVKKSDEIYEYFDLIAHKANNLYNASLFRLRQIMTGLNKDSKALSDNELEVFREVDRTVAINTKLSRPTKKNPYVSYQFLYHMMYINENPDYICDDLPSQTAQQVLKVVVQDMKSFLKSKSDYLKNRHKYLGEPKIPKYKNPGGKYSFKFTNQQVVIDEDLISFPKTKIKLDKFSYINKEWKLKEVKIVPVHNVYVMHMTFDDMLDNRAIKQKHERICAIDLGVNNFVAMTNNFNKPSMLFKGGRVKSVNHWYNKTIAKLISKQTKGTTNKYVPTTKYKAITLKRNNIMSDFMHKVARRVVDYCIEENVDTLVVGDNKGWKQEVKLSKVENQKFVQIPFDRFKNNLEYLCKREGIELVFTEESYTSKASHLDNDKIPNLNDTAIEFSGVRGPTKYLGRTNTNGYRGLYMRKTDNTVINSDLNGSANIGRKAFPLYTCSLDTFKNILVVKDPN